MKPDILRKKVYDMLVKADDGHCGSVMSLIEILCAVNDSYDLKRDKLIISKAHGAMAIYPILQELGLVSQEDIDTFRMPGARLTMFPNMTIPGVHATLGSMGHGLGIAAGMAMANPDINVICVMGEGEMYEGSVWEAMLFIKHHKLPNLKIIIDRNGYVVLGRADELLRLTPVRDKFTSLGFTVRVADGHNVDHLQETLAVAQVVIALTIKGKGVPAWEGKPESHYWIPVPPAFRMVPRQSGEHTMTFQRDVFIEVIHGAALRDPDVLFLTADFGAPALDTFKAACPKQVIHMGISEQNMVSVATGLALSGKKVYVYAMSPFFERCYEQLKVAAIQGAPLTVVSVGGGLGYAGAGPSHYALEDIALYRTLPGVEVYSASDTTLAAELARLTVRDPKFRVIRLERSDKMLYNVGVNLSEGYVYHEGRGWPVVTCGYLVDYFLRRGRPVYDVFHIKPVPQLLLAELALYPDIYTYEEQFLPGGFGSAIVEALGDYGIRTRVFRRGMPERPLIENGTRDQLLESAWG